MPITLFARRRSPRPTPWARMVDEGPRISDMLSRRAKYVTARAAAQNEQVSGPAFAELAAAAAKAATIRQQGRL